MVTCWEGADSFAFVCDVLLWRCHIPIGILGQVKCLIVSIPDLCPLSYFAIILKRKIKPFVLLSLSFGCLVTVNCLWLFLRVPCFGLQCVIVLFSDHTHLLLGFEPTYIFSD